MRPAVRAWSYGQGTDHWGWIQWYCIAVNVLALAVAGWIINSATGHPWPHKLLLPASSLSPIGTREALGLVLSDWDEVIDVDIDELTALFDAVDRRIGQGQGRASALPQFR